MPIAPAPSHSSWRTASGTGRLPGPGDPTPPGGGSGGGPDADSEANKIPALVEELAKVSKKGKEADEIKLQPLPDAASRFRAWRLAARAQVVSASGKGLLCFNWIMDTEVLTWEELGEPGELFERLDFKLEASVVRIARGEIGRVITRHIELAARQRKMLGGRRALKLVYDYYRTSGEA